LAIKAAVAAVSTSLLIDADTVPLDRSEKPEPIRA
jgi:hypothetical protein